MSAAVKLGGGCAALARMQAVTLDFSTSESHIQRRGFLSQILEQDLFCKVMLPLVQVGPKRPLASLFTAFSSLGQSRVRVSFNSKLHSERAGADPTGR